MRMLTGAVLLLSAEQAFSHSLLVQFPNQVLAREILTPISIVLAVFGVLFLVWGIVTERKQGQTDGG